MKFYWKILIGLLAVGCTDSPSPSGDSPNTDTYPATGADTGAPAGDTAPNETDIPPDTGIVDTVTSDTATADSPTTDSGTADTVTTDTRATDTGIADTATSDTATADSATTDSGTADTVTADTGTADSGTLDTATSDTATDILVDPGDTPIRIGTNTDFRQEMSTGVAPLGTVTFSLVNAPRGMRIQPKTGIITWHPTEDQQGRVTVTVHAVTGQNQVYSETLVLDVVYAQPDAPGIYVAPDGTNINGAGTAANPYATISYAAAHTTPGDTVYVRGGVYRNSTYGDGDPYNWDPAVRITISGTADAWITYRPLGNEWAKVEYDASDGFKINAGYIIVDGFEIEGPAAHITYDDAIALWWDADCPSLICGTGVTAQKEHTIIRNLVVHHASSRGIGAYNTDYVTIENNIVYNSSWWTLHGTHGISIPTMTSTDGNPNALKNIIRNNLSFANEQRIMSRVWTNGYATLTVDEGYGIHMQDTLHHHVGRALVENNFALFNGKAGIGLFDVENATISHNSTYENGLTTGPGTGSGLNLQAAQDAYVEGNLFHAQPTHKAIYTLQGATYTAAGNWVVPGTDDPNAYPPGVTAVFAVFADPEHGDFSPSDQVDPTAGIDGGILQDLLAKAADYGIVVAPTGYTVDYAAMTRDIVEGAPAGATADMSNWPNTVTVTFPPGSTHPAAPSFELIIKHPY